MAQSLTGVVKSQREVAQALSVSVAAVRNWKSEGCPGKRGHWDLAKIEQWRQERSFERQAMKDEGGGSSPWLEQYRKFRAREVELRVGEQEGALLRRDEVDERWKVRILAMKHQIRTLGKRLAAKMDGMDQFERLALLEEDNDRMLRELARGHVGISEETVERLFEFFAIVDGEAEASAEG